MSSQSFWSTDLLGWLTNGIPDGLAVIFQDRMILDNDRFRHLIQTVASRADTSQTLSNASSSPLPTKEPILNDAAAWNDQPLENRWTRRYHGIDLAGSECFDKDTFTLVPFRQKQAVLVVLEDLTEHVRLASEVDVSSRFQTVFARIGELALSEVPVQSIMNEAVQLTAEALRVELCNILILRTLMNFCIGREVLARGMD